MKEPHKKNTGYWAFVSALVASIGIYMGYDIVQSKPDIPGSGALLTSYTPDEKAALERGYADCQRIISQRGAEYERSILSRSCRVPELAETLTGWSAKWQVIKSMGDEAETNAWVAAQVEPALYDKTENAQLLGQSISAVVMDWQEVENNMSCQLGRPIGGQHREAGSVDVGNIPVPAGMDHELWKQIMYMLASNVGGEVAAVVATNMAVSAGILTASAAGGWATCGISLVAGVLVDWVVGIFTDPKPELEKELNKQLRANAAQMRAQFEACMGKMLRERAGEWK